MEPARRLARNVRFLILDLLDVLTGRRHPLVPPRRAVHEIGGHDFLAIGRELAALAVNLGALTPSGTIIDAGCGYGRLAVPLLDYLADGDYEGFDISKGAVRWCRRTITARNPRFRFTHADVRNRHYNPFGLIDPRRFTFPWADSTADLVFASSLFTHLQLDAARRYIEESSRVLKPGGRLVASFFLLNAESRRAVAVNAGLPKFTWVTEEVAYQDPADPEAAVAVSEPLLREILSSAGLRTIQVQYGGWCERPGGTGFQDFVVAERGGGK